MEWFNEVYNSYIEWIYGLGATMKFADSIAEFTLFILSTAILVLLSKLMNRYIISYVKKIVEKSKTDIDNILFDNKVIAYFLSIIPVYILLLSLSAIFKHSEGFLVFFHILLSLLINYLLIRGFLALLKSINQVYESRQKGRKRSIKSYIQVFQLIIILIGLLAAISVVIEKDISFLLTGIGAFAAVLMLVFKDSILGFVGGIQINANDMLRIGDWVSVPNAGADGTVLDISLTTIKIQNWDKTISTVPTYSLVSGSFQNWRGMEDSGGRRIKRSVIIDLQTIKFMDKDSLKELHNIPLLKSYLEAKENELNEYNAVNSNGRHQTNIGVFRAYIVAYLQAQKDINHEMTFLVRQLQATEKGLPIEVYVFSKIQDWAPYENLQSDIFDHIYAIVPKFDLRVFQNPSGLDFKNIVLD